MFKDEARRWLKALKIAKIIFQDQGFHTLHLEGMEKFIRRRILYRRNIREDHLPVLSRISASKNLPMTRLVNEIIKNYLTEKEAPYDERKSQTGFREHRPEVQGR